MNDNEKKVKEKYESEGYIMIHRGSPDFLGFKYENGIIKDIFFVEVKDSGFQTLEQLIWQCALQSIGCDFYVHSSKGDMLTPYIDRNYAVFDCSNCNHKIMVSKEKMLIEIKKMNNIRRTCFKGEWNVTKLIEDYLKKRKLEG